METYLAKIRDMRRRFDKADELQRYNNDVRLAKQRRLSRVTSKGIVKADVLDLTDVTLTAQRHISSIRHSLTGHAYIKR